MQVQSHAHKLSRWLVSYGTYLELICIGIRAGNREVCGCSSLAELHRQYQELLPQNSRDAVDLAACHRAVIEALCRLRERRHAPGQEECAELDLSNCRRAHSTVLSRMLGSLRALDEGRSERPSI